MDKHGFQKKLRSLLEDNRVTPLEINEYLKTLTPSGIELEFMGLSLLELNGNNISLNKHVNLLYYYTLIDLFDVGLFL